MREDIEFRTEDGVTLRGWHYAPEGVEQPPLVVMAHGFSAVKEHLLDDFAGYFCDGGLGVLVRELRVDVDQAPVTVPVPAPRDRAGERTSRGPGVRDRIRAGRGRGRRLRAPARDER